VFGHGEAVCTVNRCPETDATPTSRAGAIGEGSGGHQLLPEEPFTPSLPWSADYVSPELIVRSACEDAL
jgi:hypothetical protein